VAEIAETKTIVIMKKIFFVLASLPCIALLNVTGQNLSSWYNVRELAAKTWVIDDHGADNMYLVEGTDSALLIDTGLGSADLASLLRKLTAKPLIVVNTHGHPDHSGSNYQFSKVYIHPADSADARKYNLPETRTGAARTMQQGNVPEDNDLYKGKPFNTTLSAVHEGQLFRLGGRILEVIEAPGHTPGEICLLDRENKMLFTGDNSNVLVWLFLPNCRPLGEYLATLQKLEGLMPEFKTIFPGHGTPLPADFLNDQITCVKGILDGRLERKPYESFAGKAMVSVWGRASVAFNPENL
jgi:glyoxylase-like metal-dependent hydrolase (beta-lactamase superfamily II)